MDLLFTSLQALFVAGQVSAGLYLVYGAYLCVSYLLSSSTKPQPELRGGVHRFGPIVST